MTTAPNVVIVDENEDTTDIITGRLRSKGFQAFAVPSGSALLEKLGDRHWDLIVLDARLPDADYAQVVRQVREKSPDRHIPIVIVGTSDSTQEEIAALDAGADCYIAKPINFPQFEARLRALHRLATRLA